MNTAPQPREEIRPLAVYTIAEAAALMRLHRQTIAARIATGAIKARGRFPRILGAELIRYVSGTKGAA